ncbi:hypothetical protein REC12_04545 [Desulfosporosinus sp. PR]|uniref:hypothetical protein n=1 Tax=Candidatus Desulfosporosinus nitrosoreducens TaxID=3401928 RepID=UPI0027EEFFA4|nr:hypothetical protein [Desulfosporosinus sp. PR]MDQ7092850.1 hypothetical protein [Desulfosporosinus sp. PR]
MVNTPEWDSDFFAQIQSTQDLLSKELNICLVLVNSYCKEITLPSSLPLICHEAESSKANCLDYYMNLIKQISNGKQISICTCPKGLYSTILQSSIKNNGPLYLIAGRTENLFQLIRVSIC